MTKKLQILIPLFFLIMLTLSCNLPYRTNPLTAYSDGLIQNHVSRSDPNVLPSYTLSVDQTMVMNESGLPDRFTIQFDRNEDRTEIWYYDQIGLKIGFENGSEISRAETNPLQSEGLGSTYYFPQNFTKNYSLDDILALTGETGFYLETIQNGIIENGKLVFIKGFSLFFIDNQLRYVETIPIGNAGQQGTLVLPQEPTPVVELPAENQPISTERIIFYAEINSDTYDIYSILPDGSNLINLTNNPAEDMGAACSLDSQKIAFVSDRTGVEQIYLMDTVGGQIQQLTNIQEFGPSNLIWIDPFTILFWNGFGDIGYYTVDIETLEITAQSNEYGEGIASESFVLSPDETAAVENRLDTEKNLFQIFLHNTDGEFQLSPYDSEFTYMYATWSPNSQTIGFSSDQSGNFEIFIMDQSGNIVRQLTNNPGRDFIACWLP